MVLDTFRAAKSVASCLLRHRREHPRTTLRTLCVAAFDFVARADGQPLRQEDRRTLSCLLDLGALINDHFDQHEFRRCSYRRLRRQLVVNETGRAVYRAYFRALRHVERNRPRLRRPGQTSILKEVAEYREEVVRLSLSALAAIALGQPNRLDPAVARRPVSEDACLPRLFALVMLIQICDDLLDWHNDWRARLPTFATAALLQCQERADGRPADFAHARATVDAAATAYLATIAQGKGASWPFAPCAYAAFLLVRLLSKLAFRGKATWKTTDGTGFGVLQVDPQC